MLTHPDLQTDALDYLVGELSVEKRAQLEGHLQQCQTCVAEMAEIASAWNRLDSYPHEEPSDAVVKTIERTIAAELRQREYVVEASPWSFSPRQLVEMTVGTLLFSLSSVAVLAGVVNLEVFSAPTLLICGSLWSALYLFAFALYFCAVPSSSSRLNLRVVAFAGLVTVPFSLVEDYFFPLNSLVHRLTATPPGIDTPSNISLASFFLIGGSLYALVPLLLISFIFGNGLRGKPGKHGLVCGALFFVLSLPAVYLQCGTLSPAVELSWMGGTLAGAVTGAVIGFSLRQYRKLSDI
jgi:hypothetical protein